MTHSGPFIGVRDNLQACDCCECGFAHLEPLPELDTIERFYTTEFWQSYKAAALAQFEVEREWWTAIHDDWLMLIERHSKIGELFDVGCGYGFFLADARKHGWHLNGTEPNHVARAYAEEKLNAELLPYFAGDKRLEDIHKVNCISALWLIEHLRSPAAFLLWCYDHLTSGGVLLAAVPNDFSAIQIQANCVVSKKNYWLDKSHLNYFTWSSFSNLLGRCGFRIVERTTLFPMENYLLAGQDYTADEEIGKACHAKVRAEDLEQDQDERMKFYQAMAYEGRGREIVVIARKE